ncbi:uncharacterized protein EKO05_0008439 [Ascochyta rabiei]|uniref:uncharacterized protein n=1 Tax=Didymella rabiei TaxID=5454 RepID=UPI0022046CE1|nr:uncharacterized protein EKO05_0008439 [Ascochyta rabiei]UPX18124.1 hypothetical protein EKO05_0008439 [Ascochyta rabiei]
MAILDILDKFMFHSRFKLRIHILTGILVIIVIGLSVPRVFMKNQPRTRAGTIALGMVWASPALHESEILTTARVPNHSSYSCTCSPRSTSPSCVDGAATKQMLSSAVGDRLLGRRRLPRNAGQPVPLRWRDMLSELGRRWTRRYHQVCLPLPYILPSSVSTPSPHLFTHLLHAAANPTPTSSNSTPWPLQSANSATRANRAMGNRSLRSSIAALMRR